MDPTEEDRVWFPDLVETDWVSSLDFAMRNFKDESFVAQYLSPKLIRDMKLFSVLDDDKDKQLEITAIHNERGYKSIRQALARQYDLGARQPDIQVYNVDRRGDRALTLQHISSQRRPLGPGTEEVLKHMVRLWGFDVRIETVQDSGKTELSHECKPAA